MAKRKKKANHKQRRATQEKLANGSSPKAKSPPGPLSPDTSYYSSGSGLSLVSGTHLSEIDHKERDATQAKSSAASSAGFLSLSSSTTSNSDYYADESALLKPRDLHASKPNAIPDLLDKGDTLGAAAPGLDTIFDRCSDSAELLSKQLFSYLPSYLPSPSPSDVDIDECHLKASDPSADKRESHIGKEKLDSDLRHKAGWDPVLWPAKHTCRGPLWKVKPKKHIIRRICAAIWQVPSIDVVVKRIVPSHPQYTDYDIQGIQGEDKRRLVFRVYLPLTPRMQTLSVVATMRYVRKHTSLNIDVPEVVTFCADATQTDLKFEYVLTRYPPGITVDEALPDSTARRRKQFAKEYGEMCIRCENDPAFYFDKIGSLYQLGASEYKLETHVVESESDRDRSKVDPESPSSFFVGYMVAPWFTYEKMAYMSRPGNEFGINAGPFDTAFDLQIAILDCFQKRLAEGLDL